MFYIKMQYSMFVFIAWCLRIDAKDAICLNLSAPKGESTWWYKYRYSVYLHFYTLNMELASIDGTTGKWTRCTCSWRRMEVRIRIHHTTPKYLRINMMSCSKRWIVIGYVEMMYQKIQSALVTIAYKPLIYILFKVYRQRRFTSIKQIN